MVDRIGHRQRWIITTMERHGGHWPCNLGISRYIQVSFDALHRRGLIERVMLHHRDTEVSTYRLTDAGREKLS